MPSLSLFSAGSNARGQLATGNIDDAHRFAPCVFSGAPPGTLPDKVIAVDQIACGSNHTLALLHATDGKSELWGCGDGSRGQLGPSYAKEVIQPEDGSVFRPLSLSQQGGEDAVAAFSQGYTVRLVAAGWETSYVVLSCPDRSDILLSMGADDFGNLGVGKISSSKSATDGAKHRIHLVQLHTLLGPEDATATSNSILTVLALSTGPQHTVVHVRLTLTDLSRSTHTFLAGWGTSRHGQLGPMVAPTGRLRPFTPSPHLIPAPDVEELRAIALGNQHTVILHASGGLSTFGSNRKGQLSGLQTLGAVERIGCTWNGTYALLPSGAIVATGSNTHSQLARGPPSVNDAHAHDQSTLALVRFPFAFRPRQVSHIVCGSEHVLCIMDTPCEDEGGRYEREVWGWGWNEHGNLGTGRTDDVDVPTRIWPPRPYPPRTESQAIGVESQTLVDGTDDCHGEVVNIWAGCGTSWILIRQ